MTGPRITRLWDGSVRLTFPYSAYMVDRLKVHVPGYARTFDPDTKAWTIAGGYAGTAAPLMHEIFPDVETIDPTGPRFGSQQSGPRFDGGSGTREDPYVVLHLRPTAPAELIDAAYKVLARLAHPDVGGDTATMQRINAAVETIRSAR